MAAVVAEAVVAEAGAAMELASVPVSANHLAELQVEVVAKASDWVTDAGRGVGAGVGDAAGAASSPPPQATSVAPVAEQ